jgi:orotate phosphoribosyltransferase
MASIDLVKKVKKQAYLEGDFVTRAGKKTNYYIDKYLFETRPDLLEPISEELASLFPDPDTYDRIAAPELGAVPLAAVVSIKLNKPFIIVKKETKEYGTKRPIEGTYKEGERMIILEDVLTTGGAVLRACKILKEANIKLVEVIGVINRQEGAEENINKEGLEMKALITSTDLKNA